MEVSKERFYCPGCVVTHRNCLTWSIGWKKCKRMAFSFKIARSRHTFWPFAAIPLAQLLYIDMGIGVLTIQKSLKFFKIGIKSCRKHKHFLALDCGLGDKDPKYPRGVPWDQNFWSKNFLISSSNDLILWVLWIGYAKNTKKHEKLLILA